MNSARRRKPYKKGIPSPRKPSVVTLITFFSDDVLTSAKEQQLTSCRSEAKILGKRSTVEDQSKAMNVLFNMSI
jgi:hypothetical protein